MAQSDYCREEKLGRLAESLRLYEEILEKERRVYFCQIVGSIRQRPDCSAGMKPGKDSRRNLKWVSGAGSGRAGKKYKRIFAFKDKIITVCMASNPSDSCIE